MSGLILLAILGIWISVVTVLTGLFTKVMRTGLLKGATQLLLFVVIFISPVADEIIGGFQFRSLCSNEAVAIYAESEVTGKSVYLKSADVYRFTNTVLPTYKQTWMYANRDNNKVSISYVDLYSEGGWLSRAINFNGVHRPYSFTGVCSGDKDGYLFQKLGIRKVDISSGE